MCLSLLTLTSSRSSKRFRRRFYDQPQETHLIASLQKPFNTESELRFPEGARYKIIHGIEIRWKNINRFIRTETEESQDRSATPGSLARGDQLPRSSSYRNPQQDKIRNKWEVVGSEVFFPFLYTSDG